MSTPSSPLRLSSLSSLSGLLALSVLSILSGPCGVAAAPASPQPTRVTPVATIADLHAMIINPVSDALFEVGQKAPTTDAAWLAVQQRAALLAESGNLLMTPGRAKDKTAWMRLSRAMVDAAGRAAEAARAKRLDRFNAASDAIVLSCENCHEPYRDHGRSMNK